MKPVGPYSSQMFLACLGVAGEQSVTRRRKGRGCCAREVAGGDLEVVDSDSPHRVLTPPGACFAHVQPALQPSAVLIRTRPIESSPLRSACLSTHVQPPLQPSGVLTRSRPTAPRPPGACFAHVQPALQPSAVLIRTRPIESSPLRGACFAHVQPPFQPSGVLR